MMRIETIMVGQMGTNCYLAWDEESKRGFLVDPGEQADKIIRVCSRYEIKPEAILLTHGHYYYVSLDLQTLREECIARGIDIVMFGHTHRPLIQIEDELTFINPGSISYPRQADKRCTYIMLEIDDNGEMTFNLKYV